jgi:hypothetical protein
MNRTGPALVVVLLLANAAAADIPPPPPPQGKKYVDVSSEVVLGKGVTGYVFVEHVGQGPGRPMFFYHRVELSEKQSLTLPGGRRSYATLYAVPEAAAKEFKTDKDLFDALDANKVKGTFTIGFVGSATVSKKVKGDSVKWTYTITGIDAKDGITTKVEGDGYDEKPDRPSEKNPLAMTGPASCAAGVIAVVGLMFGGMWLVGRARRKA